MFGLGIWEMAIVGMVAVLLFGKKLPEVARSIGASYNQFRAGLADIKSQVDINQSGGYQDNYSHNSSYDDYDYDDREEPTAPKFDPPPSEPQADSDSDTSGNA